MSQFNFDFGFDSTADPDITPSGYEQFPKGEAVVNGIHSFISKDKNTDDPIFVPDNFSDDMIVRLRFRMEGDKQGPPATLNRAQIIVLLSLLGSDVRDLPEGNTTAFLLKAQQKANNSGRKLTVYVGEKGWVKNQNWFPPQGQYAVKFIGARGLYTPEPIFVTNRWEKSVIRLDFEIIGNAFGKPNPYKGFRFSLELENPFSSEPEVFEDGSMRPVTLTSSNGGMLVSERRFRVFANVFLPETADGVSWSEYVWDEEAIENPAAVYCGYAANGGRIGVATVRPNKNGRLTVDLLDFMSLETDSEPEPTQSPELSPEALMKAINSFANMEVFKDDGSTNMTEKGREWMKEHVAPLWDRLPGFPKQRTITALTGEQRHLLLNELQSPVVDEEMPF